MSDIIFIDWYYFNLSFMGVIGNLIIKTHLNFNIIKSNQFSPYSRVGEVSEIPTDLSSTRHVYAKTG